jgi:serine protease
MQKFNLNRFLFILLFIIVIFSGCSGDEISQFIGGDEGKEQTPLYSVSGAISATNNSEIDSDVNDPWAPFDPNDDFETAQPLPNPAVVGGYVNITGTGEVGRFYDPLDPVLGDLNDFFTVTLTDNQSITLYIADYVDPFSGIDIDLVLYDEDKVQIEASEGQGPSEILTVTTAGTYFIRVMAKAGASNYIMTVGQPVTDATILDERLHDDFVPGDIIVSFKDSMRSYEATSKGLQVTTLFGMPLKGNGNRHAKVLKLNPENRQQVFANLGIQTSNVSRHLYQANDDITQLKLDTLRIIQALKKKPDIRYAEPNYIRHPLFTPNDIHYDKQWHYPLINLPQAWDTTRGSNDVVVAVVDTGILSEHPDMIGQLTTDGYDFISSTSISLDGDGVDPDPEDVGDDAAGGSTFHGTHVAGTIAAATNNALGVAGVAGNIRVMALRVLGKGGGTSDDIIEALYYAARILPNAANNVPSQKADIINLCLGGPTWSQSEQDAITAAREKGVIVIAAAGNDSSSAPSYPAAYEGVVSVSAVDAAKALAPYSNYGTKIDVAAPGGDFSKDLNQDGYGDGVLSTGGDDSSGSIQYVYNFYNGTSMAAPHMAGVVALMKSVNVDLTPDILDALLAQGLLTEDIGPVGRDDSFGHGLIDAYKAVAAVVDEIPSLLIVNPTSLNFKSSEVLLTIRADKIGNDPVKVETPIANAEWLSVFPGVDVDENGSVTYTVEVDRTSLPDGPYYTTLFFDSDKNDVEIPVSMEVGDITATGDLGFHYILLLNADTLKWVDQVEVSANNGSYPFAFTELPAGQYILFAGTDSDNDYYLGDSGEAIGAYISLDQPSVIRVNDHVSGINFSTAFNLSLPAGAFYGAVPSLFPFERNEIVVYHDE